MRAGRIVPALVAAASLAPLACGGHENAPKRHVEVPAQTSATSRLLNGLPQAGTVIGASGAPVLLVAYADPACGRCRDFNLEVVPTLITRYVRTGKLRIELRPVASSGAAAAAAGQAERFALAAAQQGDFWQVVDVLYREQAAGRRAGFDDAFLRDLGTRIPGFDPAAALAARQSNEVSSRLSASARQFKHAGFRRTPSFEIGYATTDQNRFQPLRPAELTATAFIPVIEQYLAASS